MSIESGSGGIHAGDLHIKVGLSSSNGTQLSLDGYSSENGTRGNIELNDGNSSVGIREGTSFSKIVGGDLYFSSGRSYNGNSGDPSLTYGKSGNISAQTGNIATIISGSFMLHS